MCGRLCVDFWWKGMHWYIHSVCMYTQLHLERDAKCYFCGPAEYSCSVPCKLGDLGIIEGEILNFIQLPRYSQLCSVITSVTWKGKHPKNDIFIVIMVQLCWKSLWKCLETIKACCNQFRLHKLLCQIEKLSSHFQIMSQCHAYTLKTNKFKIQCLQ